MKHYMKPCPFCGGAAEIQLAGDWYYIRCSRCYARTKRWLPEQYGHGNPESAIESAIKEWNMRAQPHGYWIDKLNKDSLSEQTFCSVCGKHSGIGGIKANRHKAFCPNCGAKMDGYKERRDGV